MSGLFSIFNVAKRGIAAQQYSLSVTNHNIANANTEGYTRQRALLETSTPFMKPSMNSFIGPGQLGTGVDVVTVQRVRNEFLDYQLRGELSTQGKYQARETLLSEVEYIFNEPSDTGVSSLMGKFYDAWQELSKQPNSSNARTVVAQQTKALTDELNHTNEQLSQLKDNTNMQLKETVFNINSILDQIDSLNQQIISVKVSQQEPNDLMDKRDLLIDELSSIINIDVSKQNFYGIDLKPEDGESLPGGAQELLVRKEPNIAVSRFSYIDGINKVYDKDTGEWVGLELSTLQLGNSNKPNEPMIITFDTGKPGEPGMSEEAKEAMMMEISESRVVWANEEGIPYAKINEGSGLVVSSDNLDSTLGLYKPEKGKVNGLQTVQKDVDKYMDQMNKMAKGLAMAVNVIHSGVDNMPTPKELESIILGNYELDGKLIVVDGKKIDFDPFFVNGDVAKYDEYGKLTNLAETLAAEDGITAGNITINTELLNDVMKIKVKTDDDKFSHTDKNDMNGSTDGNRALTIAQLRNSILKIGSMNKDMTRIDFLSAITGGAMEKNEVGVYTLKNNSAGTTSENYFKDIIDELGIQSQEAKRMVQNQGRMIASFEQSKNSVSGVSLDEEMANLIQYQSVYAANAKVVATVDELLDVVINGLKR